MVYLRKDLAQPQIQNLRDPLPTPQMLYSFFKPLLK